MRAVGILEPEQFTLGDLNQISALEALLRAQRFGREMLRVLDRLVQERLLLREPGVGPVRELAVEFVLTLIDRETGIEPEPAGDEIVDEGRPFRIAGLLVDDGEVGIAAVARRTRPQDRKSVV